jgi:hypothetical protein
MTTHYMGYALIFTHRERECASARVINCTLIYGRFLFKFVVNIIHLTTSSQGYVLVMFTHRTASTRVQALAWFTSQLSLDGLSSNLMGTYYKWAQVTWDTYLSCSITACVCERACASASVIKRSLIFERSWWGHKTDPHRLHAVFNLCVNACPNSVHMLTFTNLCLARDGQ